MLGAQEAALEDRDAERALLRGRVRRPGPARVPPVPQATATTSAVAAQLLAERPAAAYGEGVAAALGYHVRVLGARRAQDGRPGSSGSVLRR